MSMNIHIIAERIVQVVKTGKIETQKSYFSAWQTPTEVSRKIEAAEFPLVVYKDWVMSISSEYMIDEYAPDDIFDEREPVGQIRCHDGEDHVSELDKWVKFMEDEGYEIIVKVW